jgi:multidrug efflux pump subunit AcrA (membrane-fusion protein)
MRVSAVSVRLSLLVVTLGLGLGFGLARAAAPVEVAVVQARPQAVSTGFEYDGVVEPVKQSTISSQASGRVATISVKAGDQVRAGQLPSRRCWPWWPCCWACLPCWSRRARKSRRST